MASTGAWPARLAMFQMPEVQDHGQTDSHCARRFGHSRRFETRATALTDMPVVGGGVWGDGYGGYGVPGMGYGYRVWVGMASTGMGRAWPVPVRAWPVSVRAWPVPVLAVWLYR